MGMITYHSQKGGELMADTEVDYAKGGEIPSKIKKEFDEKIKNKKFAQAYLGEIEDEDDYEWSYKSGLNDYFEEWKNDNETFKIHNELRRLKAKGLRNVTLNGFDESILYVIDKKYNDYEIKKNEDGNYSTTFAKGGELMDADTQVDYAKGGEVDSISELYEVKKYEQYPYARDLVAHFIYGDDERGNLIVDATNGRYTNQLADYSELSNLILGYEYTWRDEGNMREIDGQVRDYFSEIDILDYYAKGGKTKSIMSKKDIGVVIPKTYQIGDKEFGNTYKVERVNTKKYSDNDKNRHYNFRIWEYDKSLDLFDEIKSPSGKLKALERIEMSKDYAKGGMTTGGGLKEEDNSESNLRKELKSGKITQNQFSLRSKARELGVPTYSHLFEMKKPFAKGGNIKDYQTSVEEYPSGFSVRVKFGKENKLLNDTFESKEKAISFAKRLAEKNNGSYEGFNQPIVYLKAKGGKIDWESKSPKIYVASLSDYNAGRLEGEWFDFDQYDDEIDLMTAIQDMLDALNDKYKDGENREEWAVHDHEYTYGIIGEYSGEKDFEKVYTLKEAVEESGLPFEVLTKRIADTRQEVDEVGDDYYGAYDSEEDFADQLKDESGINAESASYYVYCDEVTARVVAGEQADNDVYGGNYDDDDILEMAGMEDEYEEADDDDKEDVLDKAKEELYNEIYDEWNRGLRDDAVDFLVSEQGIYSEEDVVNLNWLSFDLQKWTRDLMMDFSSYYNEEDGMYYIFNN